jgi:RimJ/RimL family protein N-acetyltransferase
VPEGFLPPRELDDSQLPLRPLGPEHNASDYAAWTSSMDHIRATPGFGSSSWPRPMTLDENRADLERHAADFEARAGFTYTVLLPDVDEVIGCVYIYPTEEGDGALVNSWVRSDHASLDARLYRVVSTWLAAEWPFSAVTYAPRAPTA